MSCSDVILDTPLPERGTIKGHAYLKSLDCRELLTDNSGIEVSLLGTDHKTLTDSSGTWVLEDVPTGTYDIVMTKEGYTPAGFRNITFAGPGSLEFRADYLGKHVKTSAVIAPPQPVYGSQNILHDTTVLRMTIRDSVTVDSITVTTDTTFEMVDSVWYETVNGALLAYDVVVTASGPTPEGVVYGHALFLSDRPGIDAYDPKTYLTVFHPYDIGSDSGVDDRVMLQTLRAFFPNLSGKLYVRAYLVSCGYTVKTDFETQHDILTGISEEGSNEVSVELP